MSCPLKRPEPNEIDRTERDTPRNRAHALSFTLHDLCLRLAQASLADHASGVRTTLALMQSHLNAYEKGEGL